MPSPDIECVPADAFGAIFLIFEITMCLLIKICQGQEHDRIFMQTKRNIFDAQSTNIPSKLLKC